MFGNFAGFVNGNMFLRVFGEAVFVRLDERHRAALLDEPGTAVFEPMSGRPMKEYVSFPEAWRDEPDKVVGMGCALARLGRRDAGEGEETGQEEARLIRPPPPPDPPRTRTWRQRWPPRGRARRPPPTPPGSRGGARPAPRSAPRRDPMPCRQGRSSARWAKPRGGSGSPTRRPRARRPDGAAPPVPPPPRSNARCRRGSAPGGAARRRAPGSGQRREAPRCGRAAAPRTPPSHSSRRGNEAGRGCDRRSWPGPQARAYSGSRIETTCVGPASQ